MVTQIAFRVGLQLVQGKCQLGGQAFVVHTLSITGADLHLPSVAAVAVAAAAAGRHA